MLYSVDAAGVTTYISPVFQSLFRHDPADLVGRGFADFVHPDDLKDQFIGLESHELRTPLTVIMGAVDTALSEALERTAWRVRGGSRGWRLARDLPATLPRVRADRIRLEPDTGEGNTFSFRHPRQGASAGAK